MDKNGQKEHYAPTPQQKKNKNRNTTVSRYAESGSIETGIEHIK
jgi:hypothetical protein